MGTERDTVFSPVLRDTDLREGDLLTTIAGVPLKEMLHHAAAQKLQDIQKGQTLTLLRRRTDSQAPLLEVTVKIGGQHYETL